MRSDLINRADFIYQKYLDDRAGHSTPHATVDRLMAKAVIAAMMDEIVAAHQDAVRKMETKT